MQDPIGDFLVRIKNASMNRAPEVRTLRSSIIRQIADILVTEGYIQTAENEGDGSKAALRITLKYDNKQAAITGIKRLSKPGLRIYVSTDKLPKIHAGEGTIIVSTPKGIMTGKEAYKKRMGGELVCKVW